MYKPSPSVMLQLSSLVFALFALLVSQAHAFHFYLGGGNNQKCFYQDLAQNSVLAGEYSNY